MAEVVLSRLDLNNTPSGPLYRSHNEWADFIELSCLCSQDGEISASDIYDRLSSEGANADQASGESALTAADDWELRLLEYFDYTRNRQRCLGPYYPFEAVDDDTIRVARDDSKSWLYRFLLVASNTRCIDNSHAARLTSWFEVFSCHVLGLMYPRFTCEVFGTSAQSGSMFHGGLLIDRMEKLAGCLNALMTDEARENPACGLPSGDDGLDLVAFLPVDPDIAPASRIPLCLAQCKCSYEGWTVAQGSVKFDCWNGKVRPIAPVHEITFVPFPVRDSRGAWHPYHNSKITSIVIDRIRFIEVVERYGKGDTSFFVQSDARTVLSDVI